MKKVEEEPIFVGIRNPADVRRNLLEASKGVIGSLQKYERLKSTRGNKVVIVNKLKGDIKEISKLIYQLRTGLPTIKFKSEPKKAEPKIEPVIVKPKKAKKKVEAPKRHRTELDRLETELGEIEGKLNSIS
jgi:vacuolar-type H+-ATPase subunit I/STV1|tara:strand:+ start:434 stop:826 length:393 start_codon:yes stop_codon:yes gene_type:complete